MCSHIGTIPIKMEFRIGGICWPFGRIITIYTFTCRISIRRSFPCDTARKIPELNAKDIIFMEEWWHEIPLHVNEIVQKHISDLKTLEDANTWR